MEQFRMPGRKIGEGLEDKVEKIDIPELWRDKEVITFSIRRHGEWSPAEKRVPLMSLTPGGIKETKNIAENWAEDVSRKLNIKKEELGKMKGRGLTIRMGESPSYIPGKIRADRPNSKIVFPMRASQTASIYQREIYGQERFARQKTFDKTEKAEGPAAVPVSKERSREALLGDFMESPNLDESKMGLWLQAKKAGYGTDSKAFWIDFVHNKLKPEVEVARKQIGAYSSIDLAKNVTRFFKEHSTKDTADKLVYLDISHGETQESFLYHLTEFLRANGKEISESFHQAVGYNEGIDAHLKDDKMTVVFKDHSLEFKLDQFMDYLKTLS